MMDRSSIQGTTGTSGTPIAQLSQIQLASCPVYDPASWATCDKDDKPLYDVACYIYAIDWPNAGFADIHDVGDIYAYKHPDQHEDLSEQGYLDALLEQNALPEQQMEQFVQRIKAAGWQALSPTEQQQIVGLADLLKVMEAAEKHQEGSFPAQLASQIFQRYVQIIKQCATLDGLIEINVSP
ncbi:MAG TPA: hypothetical protein VFV38_46715, partial [Ktedonobacteraceae bacterium]|nr:hypothetical protein [Ktedonobacteraceae bacterium]